MKKSIEFIATAGWNEKYGGVEAVIYQKIVLGLFEKHKCDMYIFDYAPRKWEEDFARGDLIVSMEGYNVDTGEYLEPHEVKRLPESLPIEKFWCKIDDYGNHFVATFLFPDEY